MKAELIIALDFPDVSGALNMVRRIGNEASFYKVGLELFISGGGILIPGLKDMGKKVFLDLKLHDIPNTVRGAVLSALRYGTDILDVHIQGGKDMLKACADAAREHSAASGSVSKIVGVTLLTSLTEDYMKDYGINGTPSDYVIKLAGFAKDAGLDGVVSSAMESRDIKKVYGNRFITITPGIRLKGKSEDDQKRTVTPRDAVDAGADYIVVGRPITRSPDPLRAVEEFQHALRN
jgi:orotidine-5'-phosphate decarboxylase